jgi:hypothetical protein
LILLTRSATHANGADDLAGPFEWDASGKDHDAPAIGGMNAVELTAGLRGRSQIPRGDIEGTRGEGLVDGNIDAAEPSSVHADVRNQIPSAIGDGDVHRLTDCRGFPLSGSDDFPRILKRNHGMPLSSLGRYHYSCDAGLLQPEPDLRATGEPNHCAPVGSVEARRPSDKQ